jgi:hypothetical protein
MWFFKSLGTVLNYNQNIFINLELSKNKNFKGNKV